MNKRLKHSIIFYAMPVFLCCLFSGCDKSESDPYAVEKRVTERFKISGVETGWQAPSFLSLQAYLFVNGKLEKIYKDIEVETDGTAKVPVTAKGTVYFLAGTPPDTGLEGMTEGMSLINDFLSATTAVLKDGEKPVLFYSGKVEIGSSSSNEVVLRRSIAQLDLKIPAGANIKVTKILLDNVPLQTTLIDGNPNGATLPTSTRTIIFPDNISTDTVNIFQMYETGENKPVTATVYSTYGNTSRVIQTTFSQVKRNFKYALRLSFIGSTVNGMFDVTDWVPGYAISTTDDTRIKLYAPGCEFPATGGTLSGDNTISLPAGGGDITLAFSAPFGVKLEKNDSAVSLLKTEVKPDGTTISFFRINVPANTGMAYRIELSAESTPSSSYSSRKFWIDVAAGSHS